AQTGASRDLPLLLRRVRLNPLNGDAPKRATNIIISDFVRRQSLNPGDAPKRARLPYVHGFDLSIRLNPLNGDAPKRATLILGQPTLVCGLNPLNGDEGARDN